MRESRHNNSESEKERKKQIITVNTWPELIPGLSHTKSWEWLPLSFPGRPIDGSVWGSSPFQFNFLFTNYVFCVSGLQWVSSKKVLYIIKIKKMMKYSPSKKRKSFRLFSKERTLKKDPRFRKKKRLKGHDNLFLYIFLTHIREYFPQKSFRKIMILCGFEDLVKEKIWNIEIWN